MHVVLVSKYTYRVKSLITANGRMTGYDVYRYGLSANIGQVFYKVKTHLSATYFTDQKR